MIDIRSSRLLVNFFLFVHTDLPWTHVDQQQQSTDDAKNLEEVVFGEILVWMVRVQLL